MEAQLAGAGAANMAPAVLQVVDVSRTALIVHRGVVFRTEGYRPVLSDGVHTQEFDLFTPLINHAVRDGRIQVCRGSVVRLLRYFGCKASGAAAQDPFCRSLIYVFEVLQTECALIGSPTP